jgi:hypothetical protein
MLGRRSVDAGIGILVYGSHMTNTSTHRRRVDIVKFNLSSEPFIK